MDGHREPKGSHRDTLVHITPLRTGRDTARPNGSECGRALGGGGPAMRRQHSTTGTTDNDLPWAAGFDAGRLPTAQDLIDALDQTDAAGTSADRHPVTRCARYLATLHPYTAPEDNADSAATRDSLIHAIDVWTENHVPQHRRGTVLHTETLGTVVDRIVAAYMHVRHLKAKGSAHRPGVDDAERRLAQLVESYTGLVQEVSAGLRRLPTHAAGIEGD